MITYQRDTFADAWRDGQGLAAQEGAAVTLYPDDFEPNADLYARIERAGHLIVVTARDNGVMIGYCMVAIDWAHHMRRAKIVQGIALFVLPKARGHWIGLRLLKTMVNEVRPLGPHFVKFGYKPDKFDISPLLKRLGFKLDEISYSLKMKGA